MTKADSFDRSAHRCKDPEGESRPTCLNREKGMSYFVQA
jgi:hypothetical protein